MNSKTKIYNGLLFKNFKKLYQKILIMFSEGLSQWEVKSTGCKTYSQIGSILKYNKSHKIFLMSILNSASNKSLQARLIRIM